MRYITKQKLHQKMEDLFIQSINNSNEIIIDTSTTAEFQQLFVALDPSMFYVLCSPNNFDACNCVWSCFLYLIYKVASLKLTATNALKKLVSTTLG